MLLEVSALAAARGDRVLFAGLDFSVPAGGLLQVTGRNGTGKTTLLRVLARLVRPEAGEVRWNGTPLADLGDEYFAQLCYLGHAPAIKDDLTARENVAFSAGIAGVAVDAAGVDAALAAVGLTGREMLPGRVLSQGQRRRVALAQLYVGCRPLWLLDEPLAALDGEAAAAFVARLESHLHAGGVAVVSTHHPIDPAPPATLHPLRLGEKIGSDTIFRAGMHGSGLTPGGPENRV